MALPVQSRPVTRPHFIQPASCVDVINGRPQDLVAIRMDLLHAANYNDPAAYVNRNYNQVMYSGVNFGGFRRGRF